MVKSKKSVRRPDTKSQRQDDQTNLGKPSPVALRAEVTRIHSYERNPRHCRNPEYDRIKASIFSSGMDQVLLITQRPGADDYVVQAGGNTRLRILKELYESTGEERFRWADCHYVEWDRESGVLLAHLRENELRGNLTFIDKARAVFEVRDLMAEELRDPNISHRKLEAVLKEHGYGVSHVIISLMHYAATILLPLLPTALASGLGNPQVRRIRALQCVGREVWSLRGVGNDEEFDAVFEELCRRHDSVDWQFDLLRQAVEVEISEAADVSIQVIRMEIDCRLSGQELDIPELDVSDAVADDTFPKSPLDEAAIASEAECQANAITSTSGARQRERIDNDALIQNLDTVELEGSLDDIAQVAIELAPAKDNESLFRRIGVQSKGRIPIELLRESAYTLAQRLANRHGLGTQVTPIRDVGLGYLVRAMPPPSLMNQLDDDMLAEVSTTWWQLVAFAEMTVAPPEVLVQWLDADSEMTTALQGGDGTRLTDKMWTVDPAQLGLRFWRNLNHDDWCDWLCLAHNYRELHRMARTLNTHLWGTEK